MGGSGARKQLHTAVADGTFVRSPHGEDVPAGWTRIAESEANVLQGYPADFVWCGGTTDIGLQIGNAVPPMLAKLILGELWGI